MAWTSAGENNNPEYSHLKTDSESKDPNAQCKSTGQCQPKAASCGTSACSTSMDKPPKKDCGKPKCQKGACGSSPQSRKCGSSSQKKHERDSSIGNINENFDKSVKGDNFGYHHSRRHYKENGVEYKTYRRSFYYNDNDNTTDKAAVLDSIKDNDMKEEVQKWVGDSNSLEDSFKPFFNEFKDESRVTGLYSRLRNNLRDMWQNNALSRSKNKPKRVGVVMKMNVDDLEDMIYGNRGDNQEQNQHQSHAHSHAHAHQHAHPPPQENPSPCSSPSCGSTDCSAPPPSTPPPSTPPPSTPPPSNCADSSSGLCDDPVSEMISNYQNGPEGKNFPKYRSSEFWNEDLKNLHNKYKDMGSGPTIDEINKK